ncbi:butyrophilin subfamily 3 member A2-like [Scomber japonicus]|uniref:butyrophilin subfamily 3 member A2-like n=1 Tax=Scomber japonicus TaxID=13676 RepID=UPI002304FB5D|nr:butyrophilin subfamily 3 member A2-like [Scomber japonicus]
MYHLVLGAALLSSCTGKSSVYGAPETIFAFAGGDVILPCSFDITAINDFPTIEWSKEGLHPNVIFLYRDGCETYEMKNRAFEYRTSFVTKELKNGNISLRISNVQLSDAGKYQCMRLWNNPNTRDITTLELVVGASSEPKLSVVSAQSGGVTLQCEANCWLPQPEITFLDDQGNDISAEEPKRDQNHTGCYSVRRRVTVQTATNRVTCRVHQPNTSHTRITEILIPADCLRSCTLIIGAAVGVTILVTMLLCGSAVLIWERCRKSAESQKPPMSRQESDESRITLSESRLLLKKGDIADNNVNDTTEQLRRKVADLKSKLCEQDKIILKLQNEPKTRLSSVVCQLSQSTILCSPSKSSLDASKVLSPSSDLGPEAINVPVDNNPKPMASTNRNPPNSGKFPLNEVAKRGISRQNSNPTPGYPFQRKHRNNSSPDIFNCTLSSSSSASTSKTMLGANEHSNSESSRAPRPNAPRLQRRLSSSNRFFLLTHVTEEAEMLVS